MELGFSKVVSIIFRTRSIQLPSNGGICILERFRHFDVPEIWGCLHHLLVNLLDNQHLWGLPLMWLSPEGPSLPGLIMAFRGAAAHIAAYQCCWEELAFPACCCRRGSPRSPSGWDCRIFSYPLPFRVSASYSPLCFVLLEGCRGCESRFHLRLT